MFLTKEEERMLNGGYGVGTIARRR